MGKKRKGAEKVTRRRLCILVGIAALFLMLGLGIASNTGLVASEARMDQLIGLLENGKNHRVRVQAATALGELGSAAAVPALVRAIHDESELVGISAMQALGQIGDQSVVPALKKTSDQELSAAMKSQLEATICVLDPQ